MDANELLQKAIKETMTSDMLRSFINGIRAGATIQQHFGEKSVDEQIELLTEQLFDLEKPGLKDLQGRKWATHFNQYYKSHPEIHRKKSKIFALYDWFKYTHDISFNQMCRLINIEPSTISRWKMKDVEPKVVSINQVIQLFKMHGYELRVEDILH